MILEDPERYTHEDYYARVHTSYDTCVKRNLIAPESALALHVDAVKLAQYLEQKLTKVEVIKSDRIEPLAADGRITGIGVDDGKNVAGDIYVDCTGFARALLTKIATPAKLEYEANVNRAVAVNVPYLDRKAEMHPYTRAQAHADGWTWA